MKDGIFHFVVRFGNVTIRDYPRAISDNPASSSGPSISIGWNYQKESTMSINDYETSRTQRRMGREMIIPPDVK